MSEHISFQTEDGVTIVGDYYGVEEPRAYALLLHMMPATKESWADFAAELQNRGIASLAIDERGHGESTEDGKLDYQNFGESEQQDKIHDVRAALGWLKEIQGAAESQLLIVGGSIGANLAIWAMTERTEIKTAVALSPGLDYRGIKTDDLITNLGAGQKILLVASADDQYSFETIHGLNKLKPDQTEVIEESGLGHATTMIEKKPELIAQIIDWIEGRL